MSLVPPAPCSRAPQAAAAASLPTTNALQCRTTVFGCCYDRATPAGGPNGEECPAHHREATPTTRPTTLIYY